MQCERCGWKTPSEDAGYAWRDEPNAANRPDGKGPHGHWWG
jgi:hypothetical protein